MNQPGLHCLICRVGGRACALPIEHVREVMRGGPVERVESAPRFTLGLALIRGESVPVVDAGLLLTGQACGAARFVVLRVAERSVALAVDEVLGARRIGSAELERLPPLLSGAADLVRAMAVLDGRLVELLESARLVEAASGAGGAALSAHGGDSAVALAPQAQLGREALALTDAEPEGA